MKCHVHKVKHAQTLQYEKKMQNFLNKQIISLVIKYLKKFILKLKPLQII